jgi:hypothetical protein
MWGGPPGPARANPLVANPPANVIPGIHIATYYNAHLAAYFGYEEIGALV